MKYWELDEEMKAKYGPQLMAYIEKCGGLDKVDLDQFVLYRLSDGTYGWYFDLNWEA